jgi:hypothetical protein
MLHRWTRDRKGQQHLLGLVQAQWDESAAAGSLLAPHTFLNQPQGRLCLDLHGYSAWTAQLAVLATLGTLLQQHSQQKGLQDCIPRLDVIVGRGNRRSAALRERGPRAG